MNKEITHCRNCETKLEGEYCYGCGQHFNAGLQMSVWTIFLDFLDNWFAWDGKAWITLKYLLFYPGRLTRMYVSGKVVPILSPAKLFWFVTLIFTVLLVSQWSDMSQMGIIAVFDKGSFSENSDIMLNDIRLKGYFDSSLPYVIMLSMPFFALLLKLFFIKKEPFYINNFIFTMHFYTFALIVCSLYIVWNIFFPSFSYPIIILILSLVYIFIAIYNYYTPSIISLVLKFVAISLLCLIYFFAIFVFFIVLVSLFSIDVEGKHVLDIFYEKLMK